MHALPGYGRKGMGFVKNPKRSIKNAVYKRTTFSLWDLSNRPYKQAPQSRVCSTEDGTVLSQLFTKIEQIVKWTRSR